MISRGLLILEMANNHMGSVSHGKRIIEEFSKVCRKYPYRFAFKFQYRNLDTFIRPDFKDRLDLKFIKRFLDTRLSRSQFDELIQKAREENFIVIATPFDESSVDMIVEQNIDAIKIASASFNDWPLLEKVVTTDKPIIASTAGVPIEEIDKVVAFLKNRKKDFVIMHCIGEYPTTDEKMNLSQLDFFMKRYPNVPIGFSSHETPDNTDLVKIAVAKGAKFFEKHVGLPTEEYSINAYSVSPEQFDKWLNAMSYAQLVCGVGDKRLPANQTEIDSLMALRRGVFAKRHIKAGEFIKNDDVYFAFPPDDDQVTANDWSKYAAYIAKTDLNINAPISKENVTRSDNREKIWNIVQRVRNLIINSGITIPGGVELEISHHYGLEKFDKFGLTMITVVNREYCKKLLVVLPKQYHPEQFHKQKEETFHVLYGELELELDGKRQTCKAGDVITVFPNVKHAFTSLDGAIIEEISSTHFINDSFYTDESITKNKNRKTVLTYWMS